ncbi:hypothetical protein EVA_00456, partial [gut metagenome]
AYELFTRSPGESGYQTTQMLPASVNLSLRYL